MSPIPRKSRGVFDPLFGRAGRLASAVDADEAAVLGAIQAWQPNGAHITLRDLHKITDLAQGRALKAAFNLQEMGLVKIEKILHDELASIIALTEHRGRGLDET